MKQIPGKIIFKAIVGSQAYGTSTPSSDIDYKGVFLQNNEDILGLNYQEEVRITDDEVYYELRKFLKLCGTANPTVMELLFMPEQCIEICTPEFEEVMKYKDLFLTTKCEQSFGGYAIAQIKKAKGQDKKMNWEKARVTRKTPLDFCYVINRERSQKLTTVVAEDALQNAGLVKNKNGEGVYALYLDKHQKFSFKGILKEDESSNALRVSSVPKAWFDEYDAATDCLMVYYNQSGYSQHCKDYRHYQKWLANRNEARYVDTTEHGQKIDGKNMMHCIRLIRMANEILAGQGMIIRRPDAAELLAIRRGEVNLATLITEAEQQINNLKVLYQTSPLPSKSPSKAFIHDLIVKLRTGDF